MNSTKILFLKMLKGDIKRNAALKLGIDPNELSDDNLTLLTGQTIKESELMNLSSYKLMNDEERSIVTSILNEMKKKQDMSIDKGIALTKRMDSLVPRSEVVVDFKEAP